MPAVQLLVTLEGYNDGPIHRLQPFTPVGPYVQIELEWWEQHNVEVAFAEPRKKHVSCFKSAGHRSSRLRPTRPARPAGRLRGTMSPDLPETSHHHHHQNFRNYNHRAGCCFDSPYEPTADYWIRWTLHHTARATTIAPGQFSARDFGVTHWRDDRSTGPATVVRAGPTPSCAVPSSVRDRTN